MTKLNLRLFRNIKNSKGQFFAVLSLIVVGLIVYTALSMAAINLESTKEYYYNATNFADLYVQVVKIPVGAVDDLKNKYGIEDAQGRIVFDVPLNVDGGDEKVNVRVISIPNKENIINSLYVVDGKMISNKSKDVLVIEQFAKARGIKLGETVRPQMGGRQYNLTVKGIVASPEFVYIMENEQSFFPKPDKFGIIFISDELARQSFGYQDGYNEIMIRVKSEEDIERVKEKLEEELDKYGVKRIITKDEQLSNRMISEEIKGLKQSSDTVPLMFLGIAAIILTVMISRMVRNDRTSIGVLKAIGYKNIQIIYHYGKYSLIIGIIGAVAGTTLGMILSGYMTKMYIQFFNIPMLRVNFYYRYMFSAVLITSVFCILSGLWGGRRVLRIVPAESMRPEAPKIGKRIFLERIKILWNRITFSWKMVVRNIFRSKKRFLFITLGIALSFSMTLLTFHLWDAVYKIFDVHYGEFQKMDYNINFSRPLNDGVIKDIKHIVKVKEIEPKIEYPFEIIYGWKKEVVNIIGVRNNTKFYTFTNTNNKKINLPQDGIVLSENLAKLLGVNKGDIVKINSFIPHREDVYFEVKDIIKQALGMNAYMDIEKMADKLLDDDLITGAYMNSKNDVDSKLHDVKNISSVQSLEEMMETFMEMMELSIFSFGVMLIFSGILGFVIVYNSSVMSINERTLEFSSLRVMGFSRKEIYNLIQKENLIMAVFGILIGIPLGGMMIRSIEEVFSNELYTLHAEIAFYSYILAAAATVFFVILAQLSTLRKINRLDFMQALKSRIS